ncbi:glycoside hydrolase family 5 protein [Schizopora paradoxa]|uniref:mannan endo-1,4-beta-mannosidase n=1 Tax=Schizopora paradoxa TaxID=27342 RepID=A0A0H2SB45_9AGAM|nr:glycoside hydrolase family 5 protein [Schizopora paradoxa]
MIAGFILALTLFCFSLSSVVANDFAGANSYFLFAVNDDDRAAILDAMESANMKVLRVFITSVDEGTKGSSAVYVDDLELKAVGTYDDTILGKIDSLAKEASTRGIKLIIALHDRYALGTYSSDAYVTKYDLQSDASAFYTNADAVSDYDNRITHILNYQSPNFGKAWKDLSEVIFAFDIENEAMGHLDVVAPDWWCGRAQTLRTVLGDSTIQITTGGGVDLVSSVRADFFTCSDIDIVALHSYNLDPFYLAYYTNLGKSLAVPSGKRLLFEEFGAEGSDKQGEISSAITTLISTGIPWAYWELSIPGQSSSSYEVWTDEPSWSTIKAGALNTIEKGGESNWSEIDTD